jgi:RNA polymerase sigma-70 factor (ECF subfamily)
MAVERLVRRGYQQVFRWALVQTGDPDDADDVTQDVLVVLHRRLKTYSGEARFTSWLFRVTRNAALQHGRRAGRFLRIRRKVREVSVAEHETDGRAARLDGSRAAAIVQELLGELPARQREVFDLADLQGHSPTEVAEMLGMKAVTVRANLCKARRALRQTLVERHPKLVEELGQ